MEVRLSIRTRRLRSLVAAAAASIASVAAALGAPEADLQQPAARSIARLALTDLRIVTTPDSRDFQIAQELLAVAWSLDPSNQIILRQYIECADNAGDSAKVIELTRELVKLDPADTVAQLRLISFSLRARQNADDRLAAYDRWLSSEGDKIDPSVRSRLALDAALLAREQGDAAGFARRLGRALELDSTNKDAATLALAFFQQRLSDPVGEFELMLAVLKADPLDLDLHRTIARHLAASGAYKGSGRFYRNVSNLLAINRLSVAETESADVDVVRWMVDGPRTVVERYDRLIFENRQAIRRQRADAEESGKPLELIKTPEEIRLTMSSEWVRLLAAVGLGDPQLLDNAIDEFVESARQDSEALSDPTKRPESMTDAESLARIRGLLEESTWARLLANKYPDKVAEGLDALRADPQADPEKLAALEGWALLRRGDLDGADRLFKPIADRSVPAALGLCAVLEARDDKPAAAAAYQAFARAHSGQLHGAYAATRYQAVTGKPLPLEPIASRLESLAAGVPPWLEEVIVNPHRIQSLEARLNSTTARPLESVEITLTLRNSSPVPMGLGPDRPISSRFLIAPRLTVGTDHVPTGTMLQVASLERRLRLLPREELVATVPADVPLLSMLLEEATARRCTVRYRILQGFEAATEQTFSEGPHSLTAECGPLTREVIAKAVVDVPALIRFAEQGNARDAAEAVYIVRGRSLGMYGTTPLTPDELAAFYTALARNLPKFDPVGQALVLTAVAPAARDPVVTVVDDVARTLPDLRVRTVFLITRAGKGDDPVFSDSTLQADPRLGPLAQLVQQRLNEGVGCYANSIGGAGSTAEPPPVPAPATEENRAAEPSEPAK